MAEFVIVNSKPVEVHPELVEVGRHAAEAFHTALLGGRTFPFELLEPGDGETPTSREDDAIAIASTIRGARLARLDAWAKVENKTASDERAKADEAKKRAAAPVAAAKSAAAPPSPSKAGASTAQEL